MSDQQAASAFARRLSKPQWDRVVVKLSGEALAGKQGFGIDPDVIKLLAQEIISARSMGVEVAVVVGGGNIWRGAQGEHAGMDRAQADTMGMLATVINGIGLQDTLEQLNQPTRVMSAIPIDSAVEPYIRRRALRHLEKGRVVILAGGLGAPFFTTDTPAALRAAELNAQAVIKGTHGGVDGIYDGDPKKVPGAIKLDELTYQTVLTEGYTVMDTTSITFCMDNGIPIVVYDALTPGNLYRVLKGEKGVGSLVQHNTAGS